ncbi:MAG: S-layer homology domain-containing protein [Oscillospiraceae bacterium]
MPGDAWYARYVNWAAANAIVNGTSETTFDPNAAISRQDMAVMLYRYAQQYGIALRSRPQPRSRTRAASRPTPCRRAGSHRAGVINGMPDAAASATTPRPATQACAVLCAL